MATEQHNNIIILLFLCSICISKIAVSQNHEDLTRRISKIEDGSCVKGQIYKMDCNTCHCTAGSLLCTKMACIKAPGLKKRTKLLRSGNACTPGKFYKDGCRRCFCSDEQRLYCGRKDCRTVAKRTPCVGIGLIDPGLECIQCWCVDGTNVCKAIPGCVPTGIHIPLELRSNELCTPGMVYKQDCNRCLCNQRHSLQCTLKKCLDHKQSKHLHAIPHQWIDYTKLRARKSPVNLL